MIAHDRIFAQSEPGEEVKSASPFSEEAQSNSTPKYPVNFDGIPSGMKQMDQWVLWKCERRVGKPTKVPYQPNGKKASTTDESTWSSFEAVKIAYMSGSFDGIGFMLANGFAGVDLDHCRDPSTGLVDSWAKAYLDRLRSYSEVSPSGEGVHCIVKGKLPAGRRRVLKGDGYRSGAAIEMYSADRFFTVTGDRL
jgi:putative DNA primase/helicase